MIVALRDHGGLRLPTGDILMPDPILVGRNEEKLRTLAAARGMAVEIFNQGIWDTPGDKVPARIKERFTRLEGIGS